MRTSRIARIRAASASTAHRPPHHDGAYEPLPDVPMSSRYTSWPLETPETGLWLYVALVVVPTVLGVLAGLLAGRSGWGLARRKC
ncbi:hypothetical protein RHRU231_690006 [Rhodococcus ruber]|uniref:Uncharacterized protein n=1 Tax=Rhodococcus ruber TaxID=1830 RepID=A0A098BNI1_9NOCA|nr:hypothetical protein RHRU231_690006 [Rhodococcus ruber]